MIAKLNLARFAPDRKHLPILITVGLFVLLYLGGALRYDNFLTTRVFLNLFIDNAYLLITAIGMTMVIISGGIDLSVAGMMALTTMVSAVLVEQRGLHIAAVIPLVLLMGTALGAAMGFVIQVFKVQPFIVTLAGLFFTRGMCYVISTQSVSVTNPAYMAIAKLRVPVGDSFISIGAIIALAVLGAAIVVMHTTPFGRTLYAMGDTTSDTEQSARLMGLPVGRTKILVYTLNGFLSALAGTVFTFYMLSGYGGHLNGAEMDAIAAAVIGGTALTGGYGMVIGTLFGVLIQGEINTLIMFDGTLNSWWTKIVVGLLTLFFIMMQSVLKSSKANG